MGSLDTHNKHQGGLHRSLFNFLNFRKPTEDTRTVSSIIPAEKGQDLVRQGVAKRCRQSRLVYEPKSGVLNIEPK
jgi:hypothetical protein